MISKDSQILTISQTRGPAKAPTLYLLYADLFCMFLEEILHSFPSRFYQFQRGSIANINKLN